MIRGWSNARAALQRSTARRVASDACSMTEVGAVREEAGMLKNIDPILSPELLSTLRAMGHGDELAIVDANYPATSSGRPLIRMDGVATATRVLEAVLSLMPLDEFVPCAAFHMQVVDDPMAQMPIFAEFRASLERYEPKMARLEGIERFAFYQRVRGCFAVVATGERR